MLRATDVFTLSYKCGFNDSPEMKIGHIRADNDNYRWWTTYFPDAGEEYKTQAVKEEVNCLWKLISRLFPKYGNLVCFCESHPEAAVNSGSDNYNFFVEGKEANYWIRCITRFRDYNVYVNIYRKGGSA